MSYAELHCISNFTFLQGASHPEELVMRAHELGYRALALTDECSVAGVVRAHEAAKERGLQLIIGSGFRLCDGPQLVLLATDRLGYGELCTLITRGRRQSAKGEYSLNRRDLEQGLEHCLALLIPPREGDGLGETAWFSSTFAGRGWLVLELLREAGESGYRRRVEMLASRFNLPLVAAGGVWMHSRARRPLRDLLTAIRLNQSVAELGRETCVNAERRLRSLDELRALYPEVLLAESLRIAERCRFSLDELRYEYPDDVTPLGSTPQAFLRELTEQGIARRWPDGCPATVRAQIEHELGLIGELRYEAYFLTVWDLVRFARERGILCQGRGSAANSAVCYCLGVTEVDPSRMNLLFERFISRERGEPPDIDVDFEHERREEVIQYLYGKYGRGRAALAAALITYRPKSALRDTAKALGLGPDQVERLAAAMSGWGRRGAILGDTLREAGFDPENPLIRRLLWLSNELLGFPRHLSQHVGGFVIAKGELSRLVPIENAAMPGRTVIQWDKNDLEALGLLKVDVLALGMLSAIRRALALISYQLGRPFGMADIPPEDPAVYRMIQQADTIGVFQIESRAQMSMLPRLRPACFYDLVIEVAIVRPGPIQGDMVHPYLQRRQGLEPVSYPSEAVRGVLERTLGVPIFQEQVIKLAMVAAGFSAGEADRLRRAMAAWRRRGGLEPYEHRLLQGMCERGYSEEFARRIYRQIQGFGEYGFPESHAASFALLVYVSAWIKHHHPAVFAAALLNSQPMGFYAPAQLVRDAGQHGVQVLPVEVNFSDWDCSLEAKKGLRLGLRLVRGLSWGAAERITAGRPADGFRTVAELATRCGLNRADLKALAAADALVGLAGDRHQALWQVAGVEAPLPLIPYDAVREQIPLLPPSSEGESLLADYRSLGLSLRGHPLALLRGELRRRRFLSAAEVAERPPGSLVRTAGLVLIRQRPGKGNAVFITLEDESGSLNLIVWRNLAGRQRRVLLSARLLGVRAEIQRADGVQHLVVRRLEDHSSLLSGLAVRSRDFH